MKTRIVTVISDRKKALKQCSTAKKIGTDLIELRFDLLFDEHSARPNDLSMFAARIKKATSLPVIGTFRLKNEGGNWKNDINRLEFIQAVIPHIDYLDLEVRSELAARISSDLIKVWKPVMYSYHNFRKTEKASAIASYFKVIAPFRQKYVKVAQTVKKPSDFELQCQLFSLFKNKGAHITIIPMSASSKHSMLRIVSCLVGSFFTYSFVGESVAPGQLDLKTIKSILN